MGENATLRIYLNEWAGGDTKRQAVSQIIEAIADSCRVIGQVISKGDLGGSLGACLGENVGGDTQKALDIQANDLLVARLMETPVAHIASEEIETAISTGNEDAPFCVAMDPLDGSSNIDVNVSIGTIFSVLPALEGVSDPDRQLRQPGANQVAAGYVIYGPQTALVLTVGEGTQLFTLDQASGNFQLTVPDSQIPADAKEFAINASNYRHWDDHVRLYINDCMAGVEGPRGKNFNTRWIASLVAEAHRILSRGGVFLYPSDDRKGYENGRLRLLYEANPIALLIEQAGGGATTGTGRVLEVEPKKIHQHVPLIFGSRNEVSHIERYHGDIGGAGERSPLFGNRGLFRN